MLKDADCQSNPLLRTPRTDFVSVNHIICGEKIKEDDGKAQGFIVWSLPMTAWLQESYWMKIQTGLPKKEYTASITSENKYSWDASV